MFSRISKVLKEPITTRALMVGLFFGSLVNTISILNMVDRKLETKINHLGHRHHNMFSTKPIGDVKLNEKVFVMRQKTYDKYGNETTI